MVYVGPRFRCLTSKHWPWEWATHLEADTPKELAAFAKLIGLKRAWRQPPTKHHPWPRYDLTTSKRAAAVVAGAVEQTDSEMVARWQYLRLKQAPTGAERSEK